MSSSINITLLSHCTKLTIDKYPWVTDFNSSFINYLNKSEIMDLIGVMLETASQNNFNGSVRYVLSFSFKYISKVLPTFYFVFIASLWL